MFKKNANINHLRNLAHLIGILENELAKLQRKIDTNTLTPDEALYVERVRKMRAEIIYEFLMLMNNTAKNRKKFWKTIASIKF